MESISYNNEFNPSDHPSELKRLQNHLIGFFEANQRRRKVELYVVPKQQAKNAAERHAAKTAARDAGQAFVTLGTRNVKKPIWRKNPFRSEKPKDRPERLEHIKTSNHNTLAVLERAGVPLEAVDFLFFEDQFLSGSVGRILTHAIRASNASDDVFSSEKHKQNFFSEAASFAMNLFREVQIDKGRQVLSGLIKKYSGFFDKWLETDSNRERFKQVIGSSLLKILTDENYNIQIQDLLQIITLDELLPAVTKENYSFLCQKLREAYIPNEAKGKEFSNAVLTAFEQRINQSARVTKNSQEEVFSHDSALFGEYNQLAISVAAHNQLGKDLSRWLNVMFFDGTSLLKLVCKFIQEIETNQDFKYQAFFTEWMPTISKDNKEEIRQFISSEADIGKETGTFDAKRLKLITNYLGTLDDGSVSSPFRLALCFIFVHQLSKLLQAAYVSDVGNFIKCCIKSLHQGIFADINKAATKAYNQLIPNSPLRCKLTIMHSDDIKMNFIRENTSTSETPALYLSIQVNSSIGMIQVKVKKIAEQAPRHLFDLDIDYGKNTTPESSYKFKAKFLMSMNDQGEMTVQGTKGKISLALDHDQIS